MNPVPVVLGEYDLSIELVGADIDTRRHRLLEKHRPAHIKAFDASRPQCSNRIVHAKPIAGECAHARSVYKSNDVGNARGSISFLHISILRRYYQRCYRACKYLCCVHTKQIRCTAHSKAAKRQHTESRPPQSPV